MRGLCAIAGWLMVVTGTWQYDPPAGLIAGGGMLLAAVARSYPPTTRGK